MKRLLALSLIVNTLLLLYLGYKWIQRVPKKLPYSFASNPQYKEQTNIFGVYNSSCNIAFIGDSHIYKCHWSELLGQVTCNRGIGSDVTEGVYKRIGEIIFSRPKICFINVGSNDIDLKIPQDTTIAYYRKIVDALKSAGVRPVIMEITAVAENYPNKRFNEYAVMLNQKLRTLAETIRISTGPADIQPDGIHLTASGYFKWKVAINYFLHGVGAGPRQAHIKKNSLSLLSLSTLFGVN